MDVLEIAILCVAVAAVAGVLLVYGVVMAHHLSDIGLLLSCIDYVIEHPGETKLVYVRIIREIEAIDNILRTSDGLVYTFPDTVTIVIDSGRLVPGVYYIICNSTVTKVEYDSTSGLGRVYVEVHVRPYAPP